MRMRACVYTTRVFFQEIFIIQHSCRQNITKVFDFLLILTSITFLMQCISNYKFSKNPIFSPKLEKMFFVPFDMTIKALPLSEPETALI